MTGLRPLIARRHFLSSTVLGTIIAMLPLSGAAASTTTPPVPTLSPTPAPASAGAAIADSPILGAAATFAPSDDPSIRPFHYHASDEQLADLKRRIKATKWPDRETVNDDFPGRSPRDDAEARRLLGEPPRLATRRGASLLLSALPDQHRRPRHPLHSREVETSQRASHRHHPRLARLDHRAIEGHRSADRSDRVRRLGFGCLRRRHPVAARLRFLGQADDSRLGRATDRPRLGNPHEPPRLQSLRCPGRRLGQCDQRGHGPAAAAGPGRDPHQHVGDDPAGRGRNSFPAGRNRPASRRTRSMRGTSWSNSTPTASATRSR